jgi:uncharacterized protein YdaU (DUF1376 family)
VNFYDFHIGDYASRTAHLEPMEDLAYRRMLDLYYMREEALPSDVQEVARLLRLRGQETVIQAVLAEFFTLTDRGWEHAKCEAVIAIAVDKREKAQASAAKRWDSERTANAMRSHSDGSTDDKKAECIGNAPSPSPSPTTHKKDSAVALLLKRGIPEDLARDFNAIRKAKRTPLTLTAIEGIEREAGKAGLTLEQALRECCARGWQGFKADWLTRDGKAAPTATVPARLDSDAALKKLDADRALTKPPSLETLERMAKLRQGAPV